MDSELSAVKTSNLEELKEIQVSWQKMKEFSRKNEMKDDGYTSHYTTVDLNESRSELVKMIKGEPSTEPLSSDLKALRLAADMQRLAMLMRPFQSIVKKAP
jgi:deoxyribodipyrimidine photolyase-like uncharacterized protein